MEAQATRDAGGRDLHLGRWAIVVVAAAFVALLIYGLTTQGHDDRIDKALASGKTIAAPGFTLEVLDRGTLPPALKRHVEGALGQERLALSDLRGTPVVLNLWASWCTPCRQEAPRLEQAWRKLGPRGVLFLGLDIQDLRGDARSFAKRNGVTYPSVRDAGRSTSNRYGATGIPETFFIDADGEVTGHVIGVVSDKQLLEGARAAQSGDVVGKKSGGDSFKVR
jgi:cytochrome c biogenesis protein CcmG/thiol:disulfide interchange protein DsbE